MEEKVSPISSSTPQQSIAMLQQMMERYTQAAIAHNERANVDLKNLQLALETGKVTQAQDALARLQRDSAIFDSSIAVPAPSNPSAAAPAVSEDGDLNTIA